ncbi:hypothetical protein L1987_35913 [Smallanthus sonchifolius]|uniref:Uncharacterized protein n=1 Tax=Smallanthus sonchifolius TaxID=185202 RepID=A0ACB9HC50_9ASTR|nr:hypothetical protein L1987_35913 [Smallanthus sonchifolius]
MVFDNYLLKETPITRIAEQSFGCQVLYMNSLCQITSCYYILEALQKNGKDMMGNMAIVSYVKIKQKFMH